MPDYTLLSLPCWSHCGATFPGMVEMQEHHLVCHEQPLYGQPVIAWLERDVAPQQGVRPSQLEVSKEGHAVGRWMWHSTPAGVHDYAHAETPGCVEAGCVVITEQVQEEPPVGNSTTAPAHEAPPEDCPVCIHRYPAFLFCSRCGPDCPRCAVARADLPVPAPGVRRMWQVGGEGDYYHEHNENSVCALTGCVPVEEGA